MPQTGFCWRRRFADQTNKSSFNDVEGRDLAVCALPKVVARLTRATLLSQPDNVPYSLPVHEIIPVFVTLNPFHICICSGILSVAELHVIFKIWSRLA